RGRAGVAPGGPERQREPVRRVGAGERVADRVVAGGPGRRGALPHGGGGSRHQGGPAGGTGASVRGPLAERRRSAGEGPAADRDRGPGGRRVPRGAAGDGTAPRPGRLGDPGRRTRRDPTAGRPPTGGRQ